jgi:hypothetical protein
MDAKVESMTRALKSHDRDLFARRHSSGGIRVYRKTTRWDVYDFGTGVLRYSRPSLDFVLALTDTWTKQGTPVDWGIEPVLSRIKEIDHWRDDTLGDQIRQARERAAQIQEQSENNERLARAYDVRRDFAKAMDGFNTSTCNKVDPRRKQDGYL